MSAGAPSQTLPGNCAFATTRWSVILSSGSAAADEQQAHSALAEVCRVYWRPVFAFICAKRSREDAQDLTQEFFRMILATGWLQKADRSRGRFRNLLLRSLRNFMRDEHAKAISTRRGGAERFVSWELWTAETPSHIQISEDALSIMPPEQVFDVRWAITVAEQALRRLAEECERRGRRRLFQVLSHHLTADGDACYAAVANQLELPAFEVKRQLHAMRLRYRTLLRAEVAKTVQNPNEIDDEIRNLCAALAHATGVQ